MQFDQRVQLLEVVLQRMVNEACRKGGGAAVGQFPQRVLCRFGFPGRVEGLFSGHHHLEIGRQVEV